MAEFYTNEKIGYLVSRFACVGYTYYSACLTFRYLYLGNGIVGLKVEIGHDQRTTETLWKMETSSTRRGQSIDIHGRVPILASQAYITKFIAWSELEEKRYRSSSLYIDDVEFVESPCNFNPPSADQGYYRGPDNCTFDDAIFSGWKDVHGDWAFVDIKDSRMVKYDNSYKMGKLESKKYYVKKDVDACLIFKYTFDVSYVADLRVEIGNYVDVTSVKWTMSSSVSRPGQVDLDTGLAPLSETVAYKIYFVASRREGVHHQNSSVYIDDVRFVESPCHRHPINSHPDYCYTPDSASSCDFEDSTFCSWRAVDDDWDFVKTSSGNTLLQLENNAARGNLRS
jgi:hypothetical protein